MAAGDVRTRDGLCRLVVALACVALAAGPGLAAPPDPVNSSVDAYPAACPAGDIDVWVTVRDASNLPLPGASVTIDFGAAATAAHCDTKIAPPTHYTLGATTATVTASASGVAFFALRIGGTGRHGGLTVIADGIVLGARALASPDQDGDLDVDAADSTLLAAKVGMADSTADLDGDGMVSAADVTALTAHLGHGCPEGAGWPADGLPVTVGPHNQTSVVTAADESGRIYLAWQDHRSGTADVYAQRLDPDGTPRWGAAGVPVSRAAGNQSRIRMAPAAGGGVILVWEDNRAGIGETDVYAQKLDLAGVPQWNRDGLAVGVASGLQRQADVAADATGGAYIVWADSRDLSQDIYLNHVSASGALLSPSGVSIESSDSQFPRVVADGAGGAVATWDLAGIGVRAQRVDATGAPLWGAGVQVTTGCANQPAITRGIAGFVIAWDCTHVYAQRVDLAGAIQWGATGVAVCAAGPQPSGDVALADDGAGGALVAWDDRRASPTDRDIYAQRVDSSGVALWTADGVALTSGGATQSLPMIAARASGGAIVAWKDQSDLGDVYVQALDGSGGVLWDAGGRRIASPSGTTQGWAANSGRTLASIGADGAVVAWGDTRGGGDVYAQKLTADGGLGYDHFISANAGLNGDLRPAGTVGLASGGSQRYVYRANAGSQPEEVVVDGALPLVLPSPLAFLNVTADHTVSAMFAVDTTKSSWVANGSRVSAAVRNEIMPAVCSDLAGGMIVAWSDSSGTSRDIYVQRLSASGTPLWTPGGVAVVTASGDQVEPAIVSDGMGGAILTWTDYRESVSNANIWAQHISVTGTPQWAANGVALCLAAGNQDQPVIVSDGAFGAIVAWRDHRGATSDVYARRVNAAGVPEWTSNGVAVCAAAGDQDEIVAVAGGDGGALLAWRDARTTTDIYAQRLAASGAARWVADGVALCSAAGAQANPAILAYPPAGAIVVWEDLRNPANADLYAQRVDSSGVAHWVANGAAVDDQPGPAARPCIAGDGAGGAIIAWQGIPTRSVDLDILIQRIDASGARQWANAAEDVCHTTGDQVNPAIVSDGASGAFVVWEDARVATTDIYAQRMTSAGFPHWGANGVAVCAATRFQAAPVAVDDGIDGFLVAWTDDRAGSNQDDVYAQHLNSFGATGFDHVITTTPVGGRTVPPGPVGVWEGTHQRLDFVPDPGLHVSSVIVDGQPLGPVSSYAFFGLNADHTVVVTFGDAPEIAQIEPRRGAGVVSVVVAGIGLRPGATLALTRSGESDIAGTSVVVAADSLGLSATLDLAGAALGAWNVVVTNPDLQSATLTNGFTVEAQAPYEIRVHVLGQERMRPHRRRAFDVVLENLGNSDVLGVPVWISGIPASATVELDFPLASPPQMGGEPDWSAAPITFDGPAGKYMALVIPRLPPGASVRRIYLTVPNPVTSFTLDAAVAPPWSDCDVFRACLSGSGAITAPACMGAELDAVDAYLAATPGILALSGIALWARIAWRCEGAATLPAALATAEQVLDFMLQPVEGAAIPAGCEVALVPRWQDRRHVTIITPVDPNDKLGAGGVGASRFVGRDQLLPYSIRFENLEGAMAPVQELLVLDALDVTTLDLTTLSLGPITFGNRTIHPLPGSTSLDAEVDLRPDKDLIVLIDASLDLATGILGWSLTSVDPLGLPLEDEEGFLPPNLTPPEGEGSVLFTVMPKPGLAGGTAIRNRATIDFDGEALLTPEWANLLDTTAPESQVVLPGAATTDSMSFTVSWAATGSPPDLRDFSVFVSADGGAYREWRTHTTATADTITRPGGHTYAFYSLAHDSSGNTEPVPETPDVETFSRVAVDERPSLRLALEGAAPNPAVGGTRVWFTLPSRERAVLEVIDVAGRRVLRRDVGALGPGRHALDVSAAARRPGLYFLRLAQGGQTLRARMAVVR